MKVLEKPKQVEGKNVCQKFNHYFPIFIRQRKNFIKAFILKNDLGISDLTPIQNDNTENKEISEISEMMKGKMKMVTFIM
jgi:hypothetical protein